MYLKLTLCISAYIISIKEKGHSMKNKARYTATLVAWGGQGRRKKAKRHGPTDRQTDKQTERVVESRARD